MCQCKKWEWKKFLWKYYLKCDGRVFSIINTRKIFTNSYWDIFLPFVEMFNSPRVLIIGLGGGTTIYQVRKLFKNVHIETVEICEKSVEMASRFIDIKNEIIHVMDGFDFVISSQDLYDLVILDAYDASGIPGKFLREEFIASANRILQKNGFFIINYALPLQGRAMLKNFIKTLGIYFHIYAIGPTLIENNMVIVATDLDKKIIMEKLKNSMLPKRLLRKIMEMRENI